MKVTLVSKTQGVGEFEGVSLDLMIAGMTRVSTDKKGEDMFKNPEGLIRYMLMNGHWSPFEMVDLTFEIETSMSIAEQFLRHKSCAFQKFSGRYSELSAYEEIELRKKGVTNRQSSGELVPDYGDGLKDLVYESLEESYSSYKTLLDLGVANECARFVLPAAARTRMYAKGSLRSWITILNLRLDEHAQKEAREIANAIKDVLLKECPLVCKALYNFEGADKMYILDQLVLRKHGMYEAYLAKQLNKDYDDSKK